MWRNRLQMLISGVTVTSLRDGIDRVDVVARAMARRSAAISDGSPIW